MFHGRQVGLTLQDFMRREVNFIGRPRGVPRPPVIWDQELKDCCGARDGEPVRITAKNCPGRR